VIIGPSTGPIIVHSQPSPSIVAIATLGATWKASSIQQLLLSMSRSGLAPAANETGGRDYNR
jgi:hypothetical protein